MVPVQEEQQDEECTNRGGAEMKCKFEHDEDCCNCGSPQYMCKCKPSICGCEVPITNADRFRAMSDWDISVEAAKVSCPKSMRGKRCRGEKCEECWLEWLQQPAEDTDHD